MKLVYTKQKNREVQIGDIVINNDAEKYEVHFFRPPHKPSSEGKINVRKQFSEHSEEYYVGVFGMEWIEREDRVDAAVIPVKRKVKDRIHNEWFRPVSLGGRKSCPACKALLEPGESIWSWGEYVNAKWRTILRFCKCCFEARVLEPLSDHITTCGCSVELVAYRTRLPDWLKLHAKPPCATATDQ